MGTNLYKGIFNWSQETYEMFTHAISADKAFLNFISQLKKSQNYPTSQKELLYIILMDQKTIIILKKLKND